MASYSLQSQPVTIPSIPPTKALSFQSTIRNTSTPVVSSALVRREEAARLCLAARRSTLGSQIWSKESRRGLVISRIRFLPVSRPGSHLLVEARLFGPALFEAAKLKVLFLGADKGPPPDELPRIYTLTHSDITSKLTLAISKEINKAQLKGWYIHLHRDEVVAEWKQCKARCRSTCTTTLVEEISSTTLLPICASTFSKRNYPWCWRLSIMVMRSSSNSTKSASEEAKEAIHHALEEIEKQWPTQLGPDRDSVCGALRVLLSLRKCHSLA